MWLSRGGRRRTRVLFLNWTCCDCACAEERGPVYQEIQAIAGTAELGRPWWSARRSITPQGRTGITSRSWTGAFEGRWGGDNGVWGSGTVLEKKSKVTVCLFADDWRQRLLQEVWIVTALFSFSFLFFFSPRNSTSDANSQQRVRRRLLMTEQNCDGAETRIWKKKAGWSVAMTTGIQLKRQQWGIVTRRSIKQRSQTGLSPYESFKRSWTSSRYLSGKKSLAF